MSLDAAILLGFVAIFMYPVTCFAFEDYIFASRRRRLEFKKYMKEVYKTPYKFDKSLVQSVKEGKFFLYDNGKKIHIRMDSMCVTMQKRDVVVYNDIVRFIFVIPNRSLGVDYGLYNSDVFCIKRSTYNKIVQLAKM